MPFPVKNIFKFDKLYFQHFLADNLEFRSFLHFLFRALWFNCCSWPSYYVAPKRNLDALCLLSILPSAP